MKNTELLQVRCSREIKHYLNVLHEVYKINSSQFVRDAIVEKLKKDVPLLRKEKNKIKMPF